MKRILLTGGAGFIGSHIVEHLLLNTNYEIILLDRLDLSGNLNRVAEVIEGKDWKKRLKWIYHDFKAPISDITAKMIGEIDGILHVGASTHVDRSIDDPLSFVYDNVVGTANILEYMRKYISQAPWMIYFSTDEVFGPAHDGKFYGEWERYNSGNPYAATKAGAEELCLAYANTYNLDIRITHTMNVYGERQHSEKFIPLVMKKVLAEEKVYIHADKTKTKSGSRFYIHARNVSDALLFVIENGVSREKYNIVGEVEVSNLLMAQIIAEELGKPLKHEMVDFHSARPGHDLRYALDGSKLREMGWKIPMSFGASLKSTIRWTVQHPQWLV